MLIPIALAGTSYNIGSLANSSAIELQVNFNNSALSFVDIDTITNSSEESHNGASYNIIKKNISVKQYVSHAVNQQKCTGSCGVGSVDYRFFYTNGTYQNVTQGTASTSYVNKAYYNPSNSSFVEYIEIWVKAAPAATSQEIRNDEIHLLNIVNYTYSYFTNGALNTTSNGSFVTDRGGTSNYAINFTANQYVTLGNVTNITAISYWFNNGSDWHNFINNSGTLYYDGDLITSFTPNYYFNGSTAIIGNQSIAIDEFYIFNRVLSSDEISYLAGGFDLALTIAIYDEITKAAINNISVDFISDTSSQNYTSATNSVYVSGIPDGEVLFRYGSDKYNQREYYVNMSNDTDSTLNLYLLNNSISTNITATVYDNYNYLLAGAYIRFLRYYIDTNTYEIVGMGRTNSAGQVVFDVTKQDEYYKFLLYYPFTTLVFTSTPQYITEDNLNFQINTQTPVGQQWDNLQTIEYDLTYNNATGNFRLDYSDVNGYSQEVTLDVYKVTLFGKTLYNTSSTTSSSATLLVYAPVDNNTHYVAEATVQLDKETALAGLNQEFLIAPVLQRDGLLYIAIMTILFALIGAFSLAVGLILTPIPLLLGSALGIVSIPVYIPIVLFILSLILAVVISKNE